MKMRLNIVIMLLLCAITSASGAPTKKDTLREKIEERVFEYPKKAITRKLTDTVTYAYTKFFYRIPKKNATLMAVPSMYAIAKDNDREFISETYNKVTYHGRQKYDLDNILSLSTIRHYHKVLDVVTDYLTPDIYHRTIVKDGILSPFNQENRRYYRYRVIPLVHNHVELTIRPRLNNTQLVYGSAVVDPKTGRVIKATLHGEYDMIRFKMTLYMGNEGVASLLPLSVDVDARFSLLGNEAIAHHQAVYNLPKVLDDSIHNSHSRLYMTLVRPIVLTDEESYAYERYYRDQEIADSIEQSRPKKKESKVKTLLVDIIGENMINSLKGKFGQNDQGYFRINPILNPLSFSYTHSKGLYYKFDVRTAYAWTDNLKASLRIKAGYSFKQKQIFYRIPFTLLYNNRHNGYVDVELRDGDHITNSRVVDMVKKAKGDSIDWDHMNLQYFRDLNLKVFNHYDFTSHWGFEAGLNYHRRKALHTSAFGDAGQPNAYTSVSPEVKLIWRPWGYSGPVITADYERSIKGLLRGNLDYEKWETDAQYILCLRRLQSLQLRMGSGFYTGKGTNDCFLDYDNFRENNLPGGWNDDWSGEFELLNSNWYNASEYYIRGNMTYETPMLFAAWIPGIGHYIERERLYGSFLFVNKLHPYTEWGYSIKTRLLSLGVFAALRNLKYDGIGCKIELELFRQW